jgi:hypothetical protein
MVAAARTQFAVRLTDSPLGRLDRQVMAMLPTLRRPAGVAAARMVSALAGWLFAAGWLRLARWARPADDTVRS